MLTIISAVISPGPTDHTFHPVLGIIPAFGPMPRVTVTYADQSTEMLFEYYPDEISFTPAEFVGLTREAALQLRHRKDVAWLQS